jgi:tetratricopeptide (TPR) repeat protein
MLAFLAALDFILLAMAFFAPVMSEVFFFFRLFFSLANLIPIEPIIYDYIFLPSFHFFTKYLFEIDAKRKYINLCHKQERMDKGAQKKSFFIILQIIILSFSMSANTVNVPRDFMTIKQAVNMAAQGETIEVEDGYYVEKNIVIDKDIHLKSKHLFGAVVDGGDDFSSSIFLIRSACEIEGFVIKNSMNGLVQRDSPDVCWSAHDLAVLNMGGAGVSINDRESNRGSAFVCNILVDNCKTGFVTNDADSLEVENCLVTNTHCVFNGYNHRKFSANRITVLNCHKLIGQIYLPKQPLPPATHSIQLGPDVVLLDDFLGAEKKFSLKSIISDIFSENRYAASADEACSILEEMNLNLLGDIYFGLKEYGKSSEFYSAAVELGKNTGRLDLAWEAYFGLAKIHEIQENYLKALAFYEKSIDTIENIRNILPLMEHKSDYMQSKVKVYESFIRFLCDLNEIFPSQNYHEEAFRIAERSKARAFLDRLQESDIQIESSIDTKTKEELDTDYKEIAGTQNSLRKSGISPKERSALLAKLEKEEDSFTALMVRIKSKDRDFADLFSPRLYTFEETRDRLLDRETALIEYFVGMERAFVFLAAGENLYMSSLPGRTDLKILVNNYLDFLTFKDCPEFRGAAGGRRLYNLLVGPFRDILSRGIKKLIIIPDASLLYLPFEALVLPDHDPQQKQSRPRYLVEDFDIFYAPSSSSLINLRERNHTELYRWNLLAIANRYSEGSLPPLKYAAGEVKTIGKLFERQEKAVLIDDSAAEKKLKKMDLSGFSIIHFATHALLDDKRWQRSALLLGPEKQSDEDGLLQPADLLRMKLDCGLVVLSACETSWGKLEAGEGIFGLTQAFLYSGAKAVLSSLWKIEDRVSPEFMKIFYQHLSDGKAMDAALGLTKREMIKTRFSHPRHWAAFVLVGDSSPLRNKREN